MGLSCSAKRLSVPIAIRYDLRRSVGDGVHGHVFECECLPVQHCVHTLASHKIIRTTVASVAHRDALFTSRLVVKRVRDRSVAEKEFQVLDRIRHPNVIRCHRLITVSPRDNYLLMDRAGTDLFNHVKRVPTESITAEHVWTLFETLVDALRAVHQAGVLHGDVRLENVMVDGGHVRLIDFSCALLLDTFREGSQVQISWSTNYLTPELILRVPLRCKDLVLIDYWQLGVLLYSVMMRRYPFTGRTASDTRTRILTRHPMWTARGGETPAADDPALRDAVERLLEKDIDTRLNLDDVATADALFRSR